MSSLKFTGSQLIELSEAPSTNSLAMDLLPDMPPEGTVIWAKYQSAGRGQQGNQWQVTPGQNLTFSLIYYPHFLPNSKIFSISKMISLALFQFLSIYLPTEEVQIKWPNDLLINRKKVAGILIENQFEGTALKGSVIGIGLNVNQMIFPTEIQHKVVSMKLATGQDYELRALLEQLLILIETEYLALKAGGMASLDRRYHDHLLGYQEYISLEVEGKVGEWMIVGLDSSGRLGATQGKNIRYCDLKEVKFVL